MIAPILDAPKTAQDRLSAAQALLTRLDADGRRIEASRSAAAREADGHAVTAAKREAEEIADLITAQRITVARCEVAALDEQLAAAKAERESFEQGELAAAERRFEAADAEYRAAVVERTGVMNKAQFLALNATTLHERRHAAARRVALLVEGATRQ